MERTLNITVDDISSMENWEKEALFKTLITEVTNDYNIASAMVRLYVDCTCYSNIPENIKHVLYKNFKKHYHE